MEHTEAVETLAPERYLMGEMTPEDRDAFEEHFFDCAECAGDVRAGIAVTASVRARKPKQQQARPRMMWMPAAAAAVLAIVVGYESGVVIPQVARQRDEARRQRDAALAPAVLQPLVLSSSTVRGPGDEPQEVPAGKPFAIELNIDPEKGVTPTGYTIDLVDAGGAKRVTYHVSAEQAKQSIPLLPPGGKLPPGRYSLNVKPEPVGSPASVSFSVR
jgi:hypothetical protein